MQRYKTEILMLSVTYPVRNSTDRRVNREAIAEPESASDIRSRPDSRLVYLVSISDVRSVPFWHLCYFPDGLPRRVMMPRRYRNMTVQLRYASQTIATVT